MFSAVHLPITDIDGVHTARPSWRGDQNNRCCKVSPFHAATIFTSTFKLAKWAEELLNFIGKRGRLLHGREMSALLHLGPPLNVGIGLFCD
jgi:hypothetical protein